MSGQVKIDGSVEATGFRYTTRSSSDDFLAKLDAEPSNLDLLIPPPREVELAIAPASEIAGPIGSAGRPLDEGARIESRSVDVAQGQARTPNMDFAGLRLGHFDSTIIQKHNARTSDGPPDGRQTYQVARQVCHGGAGGGFGRPIVVLHGKVRMPPIDLPNEIRCHGLPAHCQHPHTRRDGVRPAELGQNRGHGDQQAWLFLRFKGSERILLQHDRPACGERREDFEDGGIEADGGRRRDAGQLIGRIGASGPIHQARGPVAQHNPLRNARGARGVDHISEIHWAAGRRNHRAASPDQPAFAKLQDIALERAQLR